MNKTQRAVFSVAVAVIASFIGFEVIVEHIEGGLKGRGGGVNGSYSYYKSNGFSWAFLIFIIGSYEFWLWGRPEG
jgi:hypothetical protein